MRVALFGATGAIGRHVLDQLLEQDYEVNVLVADPARLPGKGGKATVVRGEIVDPEAIGQTIHGCEAVIDTLGVRANTQAEVNRLLEVMKLILKTMTNDGVRRFIGVAGAGLSIPGDETGIGYRVAALSSKITFRHGVEEKQKEFELVSKSGLDWTILRLPVTTDGPLTKRYEADPRRPPSSRISREDVAFALACQLRDRRFVGAAPFVGN